MKFEFSYAVFKYDNPTARLDLILLLKEVLAIPTPLISNNVAMVLFRA